MNLTAQRSDRPIERSLERLASHAISRALRAAEAQEALRVASLRIAPQIDSEGVTQWFSEDVEVTKC